MEWKHDDIKALRKKLSLSQRQFAERLGVKRLAVARWESGTRTPDEANQKRLLQIAKENGLDTKLEIVSSNDENVSSKVDTLDTKSESGYNLDTLDTKIVSNDQEIVSSVDTKTENVSSKVDTNSETGYNMDTNPKVDTQNVSNEDTKLDTKSQSVSSEQDTPADEKVTSEQVQAYYETMYSDARGVISLCTITQPAEISVPKILRKDPDQNG